MRPDWATKKRPHRGPSSLTTSESLALEGSGCLEGFGIRTRGHPRRTPSRSIRPVASVRFVTLTVAGLCRICTGFPKHLSIVLQLDLSRRAKKCKETQHDAIKNRGLVGRSQAFFAVGVEVFLPSPGKWQKEWRKKEAGRGKFPLPASGEGKAVTVREPSTQAIAPKIRPMMVDMITTRLT